MSLVQWPFKRKQYAGLNNPRFVSDIVAANEAVMDAIAVVTGLNSTDFAIISGLDYILGTQNTFTAGWFYLNGSFYYMSTSFVEGLFLIPNPNDTNLQPFGDGVSRNIYTLLSAITTSSGSGSTTPAFSGNMNAYRIGLKKMKADVLSLLATQSALGAAAFLNIGTVAGTVADGGASYSKSAVDTALALKSNITDVLTKTNVVAYTPTAATHPATKGYVDSVGIQKLASGNLAIGDVPAGGTSFTVSLGITLPDNNYMVAWSLVGAATTPQNDCSVFVVIRNKTTTSFMVYVNENTGVAQNVSLDWMLLHF